MGGTFDGYYWQYRSKVLATKICFRTVITLYSNELTFLCTRYWKMKLQVCYLLKLCAVIDNLHSFIATKIPEVGALS